MRKKWKNTKKRLLAVVMAAAMLATQPGMDSFASIVENAKEENEAILSEIQKLKEDAVIQGLSEEETLARMTELLQKYGLMDEEGNILTDWEITMDGTAITLDELKAMLKEEDVDLNRKITVDGTEVSLRDFQTMIKIEEEIARIKETYYPEGGDTELTSQQAKSLLSLYEQIADSGIMLTGTGDELTFASGADQAQRIRVSNSVTIKNGTEGTIEIQLAHLAKADTPIQWEIKEGSAGGTIGGATKGEVTVKEGESSVTLTVQSIESGERWNGNRSFVINYTSGSGILFENGCQYASTVVNVSQSYTYPRLGTKNTDGSYSITFLKEKYSDLVNDNTVTETKNAWGETTYKFNWTMDENQIMDSLGKNVSLFMPGSTRRDYPLYSNMEFYQPDGVYLSGKGLKRENPGTTISTSLNMGNGLWNLQDSAADTDEITRMGLLFSSTISLRVSYREELRPYIQDGILSSLFFAGKSRIYKGTGGSKVKVSINGTVLNEIVTDSSTTVNDQVGQGADTRAGIKPKESSDYFTVVAETEIDKNISDWEPAEVLLSMPRVIDDADPSVKTVTAPQGPYYCGQVVPITVTFSEPVDGSATITANDQTLHSTLSLNLEDSAKVEALGSVHTFLYTVGANDAARIHVAEVSNLRDYSGKTADHVSYNKTVLAAGEFGIQTPDFLSAVAMPTPVKTPVSPVYHEAQGDQPAYTSATAQVEIPMPKETNLRQLVTEGYSDGSNYNSSKLAMSIDGGETLVPLVFDQAEPTKMTATFDFAPPKSDTLYGAEVYQISVTNSQIDQTSATLLMGRYAVFQVKAPVPLKSGHMSISQPTGWSDRIYVDNPPEASKLTLTRNITAPADVTWTQTEWKSTNPQVATIDGDGKIHPQGPGTVSFYLKAVNGEMTAYQDEFSDESDYCSEAVTLTVLEGANPYLRIAQKEQTIRQGEPVTIRWASNLVQKNAEFAENKKTTFTIQVIDQDGKEVTEGLTDQNGTVLSHPYTVTYDPAEKTDPLWVNGSPNQSFTINGLNQISSKNGAYQIKVSAQADAAVALNGVNNGSSVFTAEASVHVVSPAVSVKLVRPSQFVVVNRDTMTVDYQLKHFDTANNAGFELVVTNNATGEEVLRKDEILAEEVSQTGEYQGSFTLDLEKAKIPDGFRTIFDVSVKAKNTAENEWSRDSFSLYIYNKDCLDLIVAPVQVENGKDRVSVTGQKVEMSNQDWIKSLTQEQIVALQRDIDLQTTISINYGAHAWGEVSDRMKWLSADSKTAAVNYPQGGYYENIEDLPYTSYAPVTEFILSGKKDGTTTVEAVHALSEKLSSSVEVTVETLKDKLYLFQFYPAVKCKMTYTTLDEDGNPVLRNHYTDNEGRAAVYEEQGITGDVYVEAEIEKEKYIGTVYQKKLVSQERDAVSLELYPLNSLTLHKIASVPVYLKKPDGTNYTGKVIVRGGVYRNGVLTGARVDVSNDGAQDYSVQITDGRYTFHYDLGQFDYENQGEVTAQDQIEFVLELRDSQNQYYPVIFQADGSLNSEQTVRLGEQVVNFEAVGTEGAEKPFVAKQELYFSKTEAGTHTNIRGKAGKIGPGKAYPEQLVVSTIFWWGRDSLTAEDKAEFIDGNGVVLKNQTHIQSAYPFCSVPVSRNLTVMDEKQIETHLGMKNKESRKIALQYIHGGASVKKEDMKWQLYNALHAESVYENASFAEKLKELREIIKGSRGSVGLKNDMMSIGIALASGMNGADLPFLQLKIAPTSDPTVFRGFAYMGVNTIEDDNVSGLDATEDSDLDLAPGFSDLKEMYAKGLAGYGKTAVNQLDYASKILKNNMKQGSGASKTGDSDKSFALNGYFEVEISYDAVKDHWDMVVVNGGFEAGGGFGYQWNWNLQVGPVPCLVQLGVGAAGVVNFDTAVNRQLNDNDYLTALHIYAYLEAFAGIGFDYSVIALKIGLYGKLGLDAELTWLNAIDQAAQFGWKVKVDGEVGVKFGVRILFISYEKVLWSRSVNFYNGQSDTYTKIQEYWQKVKKGTTDNSNPGVITPGVQTVKAQRFLSQAGTGVEYYTADLGARLEDRSYLDDYTRRWNSGSSLFAVNPPLRRMAARTLLTAETEEGKVETVLENSYPEAAPVVSEDGTYLFYLDDQNSSTDATLLRAAVAKKQENGGYLPEEKAVIGSEERDGYGDSGLMAAGTGEAVAAVWSRVMEKPAITEAGQTVTPDVQAGMMNSTDIIVAARQDGKWVTKNLTEDSEKSMANLSPVIARKGDRIFVAWRQVASSDYSDLTNFTTDTLMYRMSEDGGVSWSDPLQIYNGTVGSVEGVQAAMLSDGTAAVSFSLKNGETDTEQNSYHQEIAYAIVAKNGTSYEVKRYVQMTEDTKLDENPQIAAVKLPKTEGDTEDREVFVIGWHSYDGVSDIRLAAVDGAGNRVTGFADSLSRLVQNTDVSVAADFQFSKNAGTLENLSILWKESLGSEEVSESQGEIPADKASGANRDGLSGLRFRYTADKKISMTAAQKLAEMGESTRIDHFTSYVDDAGRVQSVLQGTYYDTKNPIEKTVEYEDGKTAKVYVAGEKTSIYRTAGSFQNRAGVETITPDYANIQKGISIPVQVVFTNLGTEPVTEAAVTIGGETTTFSSEKDRAFVAVEPGAQRRLTVYYTVPQTGAVPNPAYRVDAVFAGGERVTADSGTLTLNVPDLGIADSEKLVSAADGKRVLQFNLYNQSAASLKESSGTGRKAAMGLFSDAACSKPIDAKYYTVSDENDTVLDEKDLASIDNGSYTIRYTFDLAQYMTDMEFADEDGEVRDGGISLYAKAWVQLPDGTPMLEFDDTNNTAALNLESLLKQADGEPVSITSTLEEQKDSETGETETVVTVCLRNNSIVDTVNGNVTVTLLDKDKNVLGFQQSYSLDGKQLLKLEREAEGVKTFAFPGISGAASAWITYDEKVEGNAEAGLSTFLCNGIHVDLSNFTEDESGTYTAEVTTEDLTGTVVSVLPKSCLAAVEVTGTGVQGAKKAAARTADIGGESKNVELKPGTDTTVTATVVSGDGSTTKTYTLTIHNLSSTPEVNGGQENGDSLDATAEAVYSNVDVTLKATAQVQNPSASLRYQWYRYTGEAVPENTAQEGWTAVENAVEASYRVDQLLAAGTYYYYCEVTGTNSTGGDYAADSNVVTVTVLQSQTIFDGGIQTTKTTYTYGETITVMAKPETNGLAVPAVLRMLRYAAPAANQMALFYGDTQLTDAVSADVNGIYQMSYETTAQLLPAGENLPLTVKYVGTANQADQEQNISVTLKPKTVTAEVTGEVTKTYDTTNAASVALNIKDADKAAAADEVLVAADAVYADANAGQNKAVSFLYGSSKVTGQDAAYYEVVLPAGVTGSITPKTVCAAIGVAKGTVYTGAEVRPAVTAWDRETETGVQIPGQEYAVQYQNNRNTGQAQIILSDQPGGNYIVSGSTTFTIAPAPGRIAVSEDYEFVYGSAESGTVNQFNLNAEYTGDGSLVYEVTEGDAVSVDQSGTVQVLKAGTATLQISVTGEMNYKTQPAETEVRVLDQTAPVISGVAEGTVYCEAKEVTVTDENGLDTVTVNGTAVTRDADGRFVLEASTGTEDNRKVIKAVDKAGNESLEVIVYVYDGHSYCYSAEGNVMTETCKNGCEAHTATATITASDADYTGSEIKTARVSYSSTWAGGTLAVVYENNVEEGSATAKITAGDATAQTVFTVLHVHRFTELKSDAEGHWKQCFGCDAVDTKEKHTPGDWIVDSVADYTQSGSRHKECTVCQYVTEVETVDKKQDNTAPKAQISTGNKRWESFQEHVTFTLFLKEGTKVTIQAEDEETGLAKLCYYLSDQILTGEELMELEEHTWTEIATGGSVTILPDRKVCIYVRAVDRAGNAVYVNTEGIVLDQTVPVIEGVSDGMIFCGETEVTVSDENLDTVLVTVNGTEISLDERGGFILNASTGTADHRKVIRAADKAGNVSSEVTVSVYDGHSYRYSAEGNVITETCANGCEAHTAKATITASDADYTGSEIKTARVSYSSTWAGGTLAVVYENNVEEGSATAKITAGDATAQTLFTVLHVHQGTLAEKTDASCTADGNTAYYACACGEWFLDEECTERISDHAGVVIPATGHEFTVQGSDEDAHWKKCVRCDAVDGKEAHTESGWIIDTPATAEAEGSKHTWCTVCERVMRTEPIPKTEKPREYRIIKGADQVVEGNGGAVVIQADGQADRFTGVMVDGQLVLPAHYTVKEGSTILTFTADYIRSLPSGRHTVRFIYTDGFVETSLTIRETTPEEESTMKEQTTEEESTVKKQTTEEESTEKKLWGSSETGDDAPVLWLMLLFFASASVIAAGRIVKKRGKKER